VRDYREKGENHTNLSGVARTQTQRGHGNQATRLWEGAGADTFNSDWERSSPAEGYEDDETPIEDDPPWSKVQRGSGRTGRNKKTNIREREQESKLQYRVRTPWMDGTGKAIPDACGRPEENKRGAADGIRSVERQT